MKVQVSKQTVKEEGKKSWKFLQNILQIAAFI